MNEYFTVSAVENSTAVFFLILIVIATIAIGILVMRSIVKARRKWAEEREKEGTLGADEFFNTLGKYIESNKKVNLLLFRIDIFDSPTILKNIGSIQYGTALEQLFSKIRSVLGINVKIAQQGDDIVYVSHRTPKFIVAANLDNMCRTIIRELQKSILIAGMLRVDFDVNIGVVTYPGGGKDIDVIKQNLQLAVVAAKRKGMNQYAFYDISLTNQESDEYKSFLEIKEAIDNKDFTLYYQPIVNLESLEVASAESLLRWKHKDKGVLPPSTFLSVMEHTGDINWVGVWAIEQLFKQHQLWQAQYPDFKFTLSTNLSPKQLINPQLTEELRRLVKKTKILPADFAFEIIQSTIETNVDPALTENIKKLSEIGFLITIDNFSNSSFQTLEAIPVNMIKLSRGFINQSISSEVTKGVIGMLVSYAKSHNIKLVAEGVENIDTLTYIKNIGIDYGQGYYFAKPGAANDLMNAIVMTPWTAVTNTTKPATPLVESSIDSVSVQEKPIASDTTTVLDKVDISTTDLSKSNIEEKTVISENVKSSNDKVVAPPDKKKGASDTVKNKSDKKKNATDTVIVQPVKTESTLEKETTEKVNLEIQKDTLLQAESSPQIEEDAPKSVAVETIDIASDVQENIIQDEQPSTPIDSTIDQTPVSTNSDVASINDDVPNIKSSRRSRR
ncbi:MAG: GGDEF domain-containing phosphodiesterase [Christensenellaceae bacterium]|jgi:EAL domain-containing protein (putative c-di-GMP-specific phosphodiesterase class I)/GGDEF domain-containing protein|nr:GGDEF domain-containing phosphodiesterase [Christensenellaceae bacterium]